MRIQVNASNRAFHFEAAPGREDALRRPAPRAGLPYECATGTCGTCKAKLVDGRIDDGWPEAPGRKFIKPERGEFLMCQCAAQSDLAIEVASFVYPAEPGACPLDRRAGTLRGIARARPTT